MKPFACGLAAFFLAALAGAHQLAGWPLAVPLFYAALSAVTFILYAADKGASRRQARRTSEKALHAWSLAGGWPGALLAQQLLRHKSAKAPFIAVLWLCVAANCALLYGVWRLRWLAVEGGAA